MATELIVAGSHHANCGQFNMRFIGSGVNEELATNGAIYKVTLPEGTAFIPPKTLDGFLFAVIFEAMMIGQPLHVHGTLSAKALKNAALFCEAWHNMLPADYTPIEITADRVLTNREAASNVTDKAVSAFSGGLDGIFTALRHRERDLHAGSHELETVVMVHGLDVPHTDVEGFTKLQQRMMPLIDKLGLTCTTVYTDFRPLNRQLWGMSFSAQLAACLHLLSGTSSFGLVGSSEPYGDLVLPWGSNPATDYLLSGAEMEIVHDGAGFTRTEKVERVAQDAVATQTAKFCWEGSADRNCGFCEKCIRTRFNFLAAVDDHYPACFDQEIDLSKVGNLNLKTKAVYTEFKTVLRHAERQNREGEWVESLRALLERHAPQFCDAPPTSGMTPPLPVSVEPAMDEAPKDEPTPNAVSAERPSLLRRILGR